MRPSERRAGGKEGGESLRTGAGATKCTRAPEASSRGERARRAGPPCSATWTAQQRKSTRCYERRGAQQLAQPRRPRSLRVSATTTPGARTPPRACASITAAALTRRAGAIASAARARCRQNSHASLPRRALSRPRGCGSRPRAFAPPLRPPRGHAPPAAVTPSAGGARGGAGPAGRGRRRRSLFVVAPPLRPPRGHAPPAQHRRKAVHSPRRRGAASIVQAHAPTISYTSPTNLLQISYKSGLYRPGVWHQRPPRRRLVAGPRAGG
jgi:hypothetical protein